MNRKDTHTSGAPIPVDTEDQYRDLTSRLAFLPDAQPPPDFTDRVMAQLPARPPWLARVKQVIRRWRSVKWTLSLTPYKWGLGLTCLLAGILIFRFTDLWSDAVPTSNPQAIDLPVERIQLAEGVQLLEKEYFKEARAWFAQQYSGASHEPTLNYYLGRCHLALDQPREALPFLQRAAAGSSSRPEYHFWLGLCYWALKNPDQEMAGYQQALNIDPGFLPAHVYAGHQYMEGGQWTLALDHYRQVLEVTPDHREALFNSGVALYNLKQGEQAKETWLTYLSHYPAGPQAMQVVGWLNANGDFSYRSHVLGNRHMIFRATGFADGTCQVTAGDQAVWQVIGRQLLVLMPEMDLHIVGYVEGDAALARCRVQEIKRRILSEFRQLPADRIRLSWFGVPKKTLLENRVHELKESIQFFTLPANFNSV